MKKFLAVCWEKTEAQTHRNFIGARSATVQKAPIVAPSGQSKQQSNLTRRKSAPASAFSSAAKSGTTRIVYSESVNPSSDSDLNLPFWQRNWFVVLLLVMAFSFFALAMILLLTLDSDYASVPVSAASEGVQASGQIFDIFFYTEILGCIYCGYKGWLMMESFWCCKLHSSLLNYSLNFYLTWEVLGGKWTR